MTDLMSSLVPLRFFTETHSVPVFEGDQSRRHRDVPLWKLAVKGIAGTVQHRGQFEAVRAFVQFVGFPRSGHSLIGSVLDAHPHAVISHELDTMGLIKKGFPERLLYALVAENSTMFSRNGRWWNGFSYAVAGQPHGRASELRVVGDKKGDWAVRWCEQKPGLIETAYRRISARCRWVFVTRSPLDNIATMSLRKNRAYDKLRITSSDSAAFRAALRARQEQGEVSPVALDGMIDDYEGLCETIARMQAAIPAADWYHVEYERFVAAPEDGLRGLCDFLELKVEEDYLASCASIVRDSPNKSRNAVAWTDRQLERVAGFSQRFPFLHSYAEDCRVDA